MRPIFCVKIKVPIIVLMLLALAVGCLCVFAQGEKHEGISVPVLMYHQVSNKKAKLGEYVVSQTELENDIKIIVDNGYTPLFASELASYAAGETALPEKPILITFDDGYMSDYVYVFPLLKKYNIKANFAIVGALADLYSSGIDRHVDYAQSNWDEIREMQSSGLAQFLSHSYNMHNLKKRRGVLRKGSESRESYAKMLEEDIESNRKAFVEQLGQEPAAFVYPFGSSNEETAAIVNKYFKITFGVYEKPNYISVGDSLYQLHRYNMVHNRNLERILSAQ